MSGDQVRHTARWIIRALEWNEPRARYPNLWHGGMPRHLMAFDSVARRLRLGDLLAVYHPASKRHPERSESFLGISRVVGLRTADEGGYCWIDLETAHRFATPLRVARGPRRVFLCCDPGWPEDDVALFRQVFDAALQAGWNPTDEERGIAPTASPARAERQSAEHRPPTKGDGQQAAAPGAVDGGNGRGRAAPDAGRDAAPAPGGDADDDGGRAVPPGTAGPRGAAPAGAGTPPAVAGERSRLFGGVDYSGDMRDPRTATWLAVTELAGERLRVVRLEATGRHGLHAHLRDPDALLMRVEAIGLDFPFGLPLPFAERLLDGPFPAEGWWALVRRFERMTRPDYLVAIQEFRDAQGEPRRWTDEQNNAFSPLHRVNPDLGPMTYHGIRMIAEERSRYAVKPFESAQGRLLLEVYPGALVRRLELSAADPKRPRQHAIIDALAALDELPVVIEEPHLRWCRSTRDALDAVIAARCAAAAVLSGEAERPVEMLSPEHADRVRLEGWIYGLAR